MTDDRHAGALLTGLRTDILERRIRSGFSRLDANRSFLCSGDIPQRAVPELAWRVAQWVDAGWGDAAAIRCLLNRTPRAARCDLPLRAYLCVRMAEGMAAMLDESEDAAIAHFDLVLGLEGDAMDVELIAIAHYWKARRQRKKGEYDSALAHAIKARELVSENGFDRVACVIRVLESWLLFQKGRHRDALQTLAETEPVLAGAGDAVVLGNIQSTYGRIYRQEGWYDQAISCFGNAIEHYRRLDGKHPNLGRTLANIAYVKRLVAMEFRRKIDADAARRKHAGMRGAAQNAPERESMERIRAEAFAHLDEAAGIYGVHPNHRGAGTVHVNRALLQLDGGALDLCEDEAKQAYALAEEKEDHLLMARARIVQCMVENSKLEEGIEEDPRRHAQAALDYIRDALEFANHTQNRRLLARAHTWHGLTLSNEFFNMRAAAVDAMNAAAALLSHGYHDTAWEDMRSLKARIVRSDSVHESLRAWSQGEVGDRTFRQIEEDFAQIVIPKVWEIEGRKVARVASRLSISPKKVRRALIRAGLIQTSTD